MKNSQYSISNIQYPISNWTRENPRERTAGGEDFPWRGKAAEIFSIVWKKAKKNFHAVEKPRKDFPWRGKLAGIFSMAWKMALCVAAAGEAPVLAAAEGTPPPWAAEFDWGPLASWAEDCEGAERFRAAGPFWERARGEGGKTLAALRPFWARAEDPGTGRVSWDGLWPLASGRTFGAEKAWRAGTAYFLDADRGDAGSKYRFWILPLWFHGRDADGRGYAALFPLGGEIRNILWKDRIRFALWPLWASSEVSDVRTVDALWPIYSRTTSEDGHLEKIRVFPFYAHSKNARQYEKTTVLWPVWTHARYTHPKAEGTAWVMFPLCGRVDLNTQKGWMFLPPFFQHVRGEGATRTFFPWPFFQRETGRREMLAFWPFYGRRAEGTLKRSYWAWPIVSREEHEQGRRLATRWSVVPFYSSATMAAIPLPSERRAAAAGGEEAEAPRARANRTKVWPLYVRRYDLDEGAYRLRIPDLWPGPNPAPVERSWAPIWTAFDYRARGEESDLEALWGLYRQERREGGARTFSLFPLWRHERAAGDAGRRWSILKGLIGYERTATNRQVRFLWAGRARLGSGGAAQPEERP